MAKLRVRVHSYQLLYIKKKSEGLFFGVKNFKCFMDDYFIIFRIEFLSSLLIKLWRGYINLECFNRDTQNDGLSYEGNDSCLRWVLHGGIMKDEVCPRMIIHRFECLDWNIQGWCILYQVLFLSCHTCGIFQCRMFLFLNYACF
jgi:hypothetical protein